MTLSIKTLSIKICGITTLEDARYAAAAGADMLGFVQYAKSPRHVDADHARAIIEWIYGPKSVGVFVNEDLDTVNRIAESAGFDYVQLHGNESPGYCRRIVCPVIKAFSVRPATDVESLRARMRPYRPFAAYFLLDTFHPDLRGGTGRAFNWDIAAALTARFPIILAGGIGPDNIAQAVEAANPVGVDCSSRLESAPGHKDFELLADLFDAVSHRRP